MTEQKVNREPRLSLNSLASYASANARTRRRILNEAKYPPDFKLIYYGDASTAISRFLLDRSYSLEDAAARNLLKEAKDPKEAAKRDNNALAVKRFAKLGPTLAFDGLETDRGPKEGKLVVAGVTVSVRPEIVLAGEYRAAGCFGLLKLHFSKTVPTDEAGAGIAGAVLKRFSDGICDGRRVHERHLVLIDVFASTVHLAPKAIVTRGHELEAICGEIGAIWPTI
jgi:hypothetical protein